MISVANGSDVLHLLEKVTMGIRHYRRLTVCSPYVDSTMLARLERLAVRANWARSQLWIITTPAALASHLATSAQGGRNFVRVKVVARLHAKFYLAIAFEESSTEAIVTSANLTVAGTCTNIELGFRVAASTAPGARLLDELDRFSRRLVA